MRVVPSLPIRPYVPPTAAAALGALVSSFAYLNYAWTQWVAQTYAPAQFLGITLIGIFLLLILLVAVRGSLKHPGLRIWLTWLEVGIVGALSACFLWTYGMYASSADLNMAASRYEYEVLSEPESGDYGWSATLLVSSDTHRGFARVRATFPEKPTRGTRVKLVGRFRALGSSAWAQSRWMKGEVASLTVVSVQSYESQALGPIQSLQLRALNLIQPQTNEACALVAGTVCGEDAQLRNTDAQDVFAKTGLSHLIAVSGSHLVYVSALVELVLHRLGVRRVSRIIALGVCCIGYTVFTGCSPSAVRSAAMVCLSLAAGGVYRRSHRLSALSLTVMGFCFINPATVFDIGFQLSALSVLFIATLGSYITACLQRLGCPSTLSEALALTLVAQWATLPLTLPIFGQLSLVAPLANLVVGPCMTGVLITGLIAVGAGLIVAPASALLVIPGALAQISLFLATVFAELPWSAILVDGLGLFSWAPYAGALAVFVIWKIPSRRQLRLGCSMLVLAGVGWCVRWNIFAPPSLVVMDVGQADSILMRDGSHTVLIDAGVDEAVLDALARNFVYHLDAVIVTHWDKDHWGGLPEILDWIDVGALYVAEGAQDHVPQDVIEALTCDIVPVRRGDSLQVGRWDLEVVWPLQPVSGEENADSLVMKADFEDAHKDLSVLLTGDAELEQEMQVVDDVGQVDVLKVGHHGSEASLDTNLLEALHPVVGVASAGAHNSYGHPSQACIDAFEQEEILFLCTKDEGDVIVEPRSDGVGVRTSKP